MGGTVAFERICRGGMAGVSRRCGSCRVAWLVLEAVLFTWMIVDMGVMDLAGVCVSAGVSVAAL